MLVTVRQFSRLRYRGTGKGRSGQQDWMMMTTMTTMLQTAAMTGRLQRTRVATQEIAKSAEAARHVHLEVASKATGLVLRVAGQDAGTAAARTRSISFASAARTTATLFRPGQG
jgi:hypothetical protein